MDTPAREERSIMEQFPHRVIEGRIYRDVQLDASDTAEARRHITAERPTPASVARRHREKLEAEA